MDLRGAGRGSSGILFDLRREKKKGKEKGKKSVSAMFVAGGIDARLGLESGV